VTTADEFAVQIALKRGLVTAGQLAAAQQRAAGHTDLATAAPGVLDILAADAVLDQETLGRAMADEFGMPWVVLAGCTIPAAIIAALPRSFVAEHNVLPYAREDGMLRVAVADPIAVDVIDSLGHLSGTAVQPVLASAEDIRQAIARHYSHDRTEVGPELAAESFPTDRAGSGEEGQASAQDAPIISLVHNLIAEAVRRRASDIHLEPLERRFRVRYRIDGMLLEVESPPKRLQLAIISRLKIMANISIAEKRVPQDGRIQVKLGGRSLDLRVSSLPTAHGESIVMRILDQEGLKLGLPELGFLPDDQKAFEQTIASPDGIMLVTGPTGSGKTTTLYACLQQLNQPDRKIITVEDPVEYQLAGINQVPVRPEVGMTFAAALRAMLRQAPNVVMVGEIRDRETAEIASTPR
jgi:type IV pilus assembly protein PilB